jgi:type I restriction enzyme S subunit
MSAANKLVPELRFPEFRGDWKLIPLGDHADVLKRRAGTKKYPVMSVETGVGLVSQLEKFGRDISGNSYKNYTVIQKDDFAYNKSATKEFPEGFIAKYNEDHQAAVPNSIFTCFRLTSGEVQSEYLHYQLLNNLHGKWLRKFITVGARAHGALSVNTEDLLNLPVPVPTGPTSLREQQKIADCLGSLDELIAAHRRKLAALQDHKKGLLQNLFPAEKDSGSEKGELRSEKIPKLRFPGFEGEWATKPFHSIYEFKPTNTYSREQLNYESGPAKNIHYGDIHKKFSTSFRIGREIVPFVNSSVSLSKLKASAYCQEGDMIFADASEDLADVGKSIELVNLNGERVLSGSHTILARQKKMVFMVGFAGYLFKGRGVRGQIEKEAQGTKVLQVSSKRLADVDVVFPKKIVEQQKIADCLSALDACITAQTEQIAALKEHKKGLMQKLFPITN